MELRHLLWSLVPTFVVMVFAAGGLFYTINATTARVREDEIRYDAQNKEIAVSILKQSEDTNEIKVSIARLETKVENLLDFLKRK